MRRICKTSKHTAAVLVFVEMIVLLGCDNTTGVGALPRDENGGSSAGGSGGSAQGGDAGSTQGGRSNGSGPTIGRCPLFPADNPWNRDISALPLHENSSALIDSIGRTDHLHPDFGTEWEGAPIGIPFAVVDAPPKVKVTFTDFPEESDPGPYPIPKTAAIEGGPDGDGDRHTLVVDQSNCKLYELYRAFPQSDGTWEAGSGAVWALDTNEGRGPSVPKPSPGEQGYTSADAAGLPILPGLARYDEIVEKGELLHALRFTVSRSRAAWVPPASHYASDDDDPSLPPMGLRLRMRKDYDCSGYSAEVQVLCRGLKRFGMIVADNGSDWYVSGAPDPRWNDEHLNDFKSIPGSAFEVVDTSSLD
jgi:hypothetical protein